MKKLIILLSLLLIAMINGCATSPVFQELTDVGPVPQGYADLRIVSSLKTHKPGMYPFDKKPHGIPDYKLVVDIDGQVTMVAGTLQEENIEPRKIRDPEAGEGIRYIFRKDVRLKAGLHKIVISIPEDNVAVERELTLKEGSANDLVLEPLYGSISPKGHPTYYGPTSFLSGITGFRVILNGKPL